MSSINKFLETKMEQISYKLIDLGAAEVGYAEVTNSLEGNLAKLPYAISVIVKLSDTILDEITDKPTYTYFHHYRTINTLIDQITLQAVISIERLGYKALAVPASQTVNDREDAYSGIFPHKTAAVKAGMGWIGKSGLFISNKYGPRVRLGTVLTDMPINGEEKSVNFEEVNNINDEDYRFLSELEDQIENGSSNWIQNGLVKKLEKRCENSVGNELENQLENGCGQCRICVESCPAMAFTGNNWYQGCERSHIMDAKACSQYMNTKFKHIGRGSVCGICVKVCPVGVT